ncbi:MAG: DUF3482 domain-containing protein [Wenzhouxiangellaceae bacterium]
MKLSVVGHTNVGKTSLMRTLMRDVSFGDVAPGSATTRQVEGARLLAAGKTAVELFDTPGLEDAGALIEQLDTDAGQRHTGPETIAEFLGSPHAAGRFEQEARVLTQMLDSDAALYVIDAREPVLGKYQDELAILALCARPILPVLNFVANPHNRTDQWREALSRVGLHAVAEFDTVVFSLESEARLWRRLATLTDSHAAVLEQLIADREAQAAWQSATARAMLAELLIDAAAARRSAERGDREAIEHAHRSLREAIARREQRFVEQLLELFRFTEADYRTVPLPIEKGRWQSGPFDPGMLGILGRRAGGGLAAGAAAGAAVDVATGGLSLGAGTLIGALAGGGVTGAWQLRRDLVDRMRGRVSIIADDAALTTLAARAFALLAALGQRGHAAQDPVEIAQKLPAPWPDRGLPRPLLKARLEPGISTLNRGEGSDADGRHELATELHRTLTDSR